MKGFDLQRLAGSSAVVVGTLALITVFSPITSSSATYSPTPSPTGNTQRDTIGGSTIPAPQCQWQISGSTSTPSMVNATKYAGTALTLSAPAVGASAKVIAVGSDASATCVWWSSTGQNAAISASMGSNIYLNNDHSNGIFNSSYFSHTAADYGMYDSNGYLSWVFKSSANDLDMVATVNGDNSAVCSYNSLGLSSSNASGATLATVGNHDSQHGCSWNTVYSTTIPDQSTLLNGTTSSSHNGTGKALDSTFGSLVSIPLSGPLVTTTLSLS